jgi:aconitate hydratase
LQDIWPSSREIQDTIGYSVKPEMFRNKYSNVFSGNETWDKIKASEGELYQWENDSTYIQEPPFFVGLTPDLPVIDKITEARVLALLGDSITTDHISPAGSIAADSPAGQYLIKRGIQPREFNSYGSRRGNDRIMTRGTFANIRLKNRLVPNVEGGVTIHFPDGELMSIYDAAVKYKAEGIPLIVLAGKEYGTGSSRDWAAKGTNLLGVRAVVAETFERIHRSNLVGMGVLPLTFKAGENAQSLGLSGAELFSIEGLGDDLQPQGEATVIVNKGDGSMQIFKVDVRLSTDLEVKYYRNGGILQTVIRQMLTHG